MTVSFSAYAEPLHPSQLILYIAESEVSRTIIMCVHLIC
jgi:hypothetical protein